jgi:4-oxalocrotonate tautomerase
MTSPIQESFMSIIQVFFIAGRTDAQKERLISALTEAAVATIGIDRNEVRVILNDIPNTEYGIAGKTAKSLGRGVGRQPAGS